ncbi:MAG: hypothetical protein F2825_00350 [Actinobacteria bacterium]|uniref:Unannotated protein n=1 Tax=freshwater metagenome TaxID=449393 RepID=A0A6J7FYV3_9ZZZZ|nr:hypothetical protein [Actinomycetota bacterium]
MAVVALTSARGAPGVSTAALAMTLLWPRPALLAECDAAGGSSVLAGYLRGTVDHSRGLLTLAVAHRHGELEQTLWSQLVPLTPAAANTDAGSGIGPDERWLLPGLSDAAQAPSTAALWGPLSSLLTSLERAGTDVIVDAGRLGAAHAPTSLLRQADLVLLVTGTSLPAVAAARARLGVLREELAVTATGGADASALGLLLVGEGRPYTAREITGALGVPTVAVLAWDPASAEVLSAGAAPGRRFDTSPLVRSTRAAISAVGELVTSRRDRLAPPVTHAGTEGTSVQPPTSLLLREVGQ